MARALSRQLSYNGHSRWTASRALSSGGVRVKTTTGGAVNNALQGAGALQFRYARNACYNSLAATADKTKRYTLNFAPTATDRVKMWQAAHLWFPFLILTSDAIDTDITVNAQAKASGEHTVSFEHSAVVD